MLVSSVRIILYNRLIRCCHLEGRKSGLRKWQTKSESCCFVCIQGVENTEKGVTSLSFDSAVKTGPPRFPPPHWALTGEPLVLLLGSERFRCMVISQLLSGVLRTSLVSKAASVTIGLCTSQTAARMAA